MNSPPFLPTSGLLPTFAYELEADGSPRQLEVFRWDDRLVAHEEASGLWWGTLEAWPGLEARVFWGECVENERVGRLFSRRRGFHMARDNGATLLIGQRLLHLLVAQDNSGFVRVGDKGMWHPFAAVVPRGIRKSLANRPTIWSRGFHCKFALRSLANSDEVALDVLPETLRDLWRQGAGAMPIRLVKAARSLGWADEIGGKLPLFWQEVLMGRIRKPDPMAVQIPAALRRGGVGHSWRRMVMMGRIRKSDPMRVEIPAALRQCREVALPGGVGHSWCRMWNSPGRSPYGTGAFFWQKDDVTLQVEFWVGNDSAHEQLESRLELRDWLAQFYPLDEVESWFKN